MLLRLFFSILLLSAWASAQTSGNRYKVSGTVVNSATGQPIARALVSLNGSFHAQAFSDGDGHFEITDVPQGQIFLSADRPGFFASVNSNPLNKPITVSGTISGLTVKLSPGGSIHGRVLNSDGEPIEGVGLQLLQHNLVNGMRTWQPMNNATTDADGNYTFDNLRPSSYLISTRQHAIYNVPTDLVIDGRHLPQVYPSSYYPNSPGRETAQALVLAEGGDATADFSLRAVPGYSIHGVMAGQTRASIMCDSPDSFTMTRPVLRNSRSDEFTVSGVPPGPCLLVARSYPPDGVPLYAEQLIEVRSSDVTGVRLQPQPIPQIPVQITSIQASNGPAPQASLQLLLQNGDDSSPARRPFIGIRGRPGETQQLLVQNARPGTYRVVGQPIGAGQCITSITSGGVDLLRDPFIIGPDLSASPILVTMGTACGTITAKVQGRQDTSGTWLVIVGGASGSTSALVRGDHQDFANLTPGDYTFYAFTSYGELEFANPEVMKKYSGTKVSVTAGEKASVDLNPQTLGSEPQ